MPIGDWRWLILSGLCLLIFFVINRREIFGRREKQKRKATTSRPSRAATVGAVINVTGETLAVKVHPMESYVTVRTGAYPTVRLYLKESRIRQVKHLPIGRRISAVGTVSSVSEEGLNVENCYLLSGSIT